MWDACFEYVGFGVVVVVGCVTLSSVYVISYEFLEGVGNGSVMDDFIDKGIKIGSVKGL